MRFRAIAAIDISSIVAGLFVAVVMSVFHWGYWSLVGMNLTTVGVAFVLTWRTSGWRPQLPRRRSGTSSLVTFGFNLTAAGFIYSLARGVDSVLIGRLYGADALGLYTRATALLTRPLENFIGPINAVFLPAFSRIQGQPVRYRRIFLLVYETLALAGSFVTGLLLGLAHPLTLVVLGAKWEGAAPIFAGFAAVALFVPLCSACSWLMTSQGRGHDSLLSSVNASGLTVLACTTSPGGPGRCRRGTFGPAPSHISRYGSQSREQAGLSAYICSQRRRSYSYSSAEVLGYCVAL
jgi:PST family polysaccharide transporter